MTAVNFNNIKIPSNRKFGLFFTAVFLIVGGYCWWIEYTVLAYVFLGLATLFCVVTIVKASLLLPLNKLWMKFGFLLGMIVSPLVLGVIFFGIFTPIGMVMRLFGRDELAIKVCHKSSYWKQKEIQPGTFKNQF